MNPRRPECVFCCGQETSLEKESMWVPEAGFFWQEGTCFPSVRAVSFEQWQEVRRMGHPVTLRAQKRSCSILPGPAVLSGQRSNR